MKNENYKSVDEYIKNFPESVQELLQEIRKTVKAAAPEAEEKISYKLPAYFQNGILVYFGGFKDHISFFPTGEGVEAFKNELKDYKTSRGTIQFPLDRALPLTLIESIVRYKVERNRGRK